MCLYIRSKHEYIKSIEYISLQFKLKISIKVFCSEEFGMNNIIVDLIYMYTLTLYVIQYTLNLDYKEVLYIQWYYSNYFYFTFLISRSLRVVLSK